MLVLIFLMLHFFPFKVQHWDTPKTLSAPHHCSFFLNAALLKSKKETSTSISDNRLGRHRYTSERGLFVHSQTTPTNRSYRRQLPPRQGVHNQKGSFTLLFSSPVFIFQWKSLSQKAIYKLQSCKADQRYVRLVKTEIKPGERGIFWERGLNSVLKWIWGQFMQATIVKCVVSKSTRMNSGKVETI